MNHTMKTASIEVVLNQHLLRKHIRPTAVFALWSGIAALLVVGPLLAALHAQDYTTSTGTPSFATPYPAEMGLVDAASGNLHLEIPLGSFPQRGGSIVNLKLAYDSHIWSINSDGVAPIWANWRNESGFSLGQAWRLVAPGSSGGTYETNSTCVFDYHAFDPNGTQHWFHINLGTGTLASGCSSKTATAYAADSSGISVTATWTSSYVVLFQEYAPDGTCLQGFCNGSNIDPAPKDTNGNWMLAANDLIGTPPNYQSQMFVTDTLGRQFVSNGTGSSCTFASKSGLFLPECLYVTTSKSTQSLSTQSLYTITYADIPLNTAFAQSGVTECTSSGNCMATVIQSILLPDNSRYSFLYDCYEAGNVACNSPSGQTGYYGTLMSMTLPAGGTVTYGYSNFKDAAGGINRWLTSKYSYSGLWSYTQSVTSGTTQQVTVTKPDYSKDVISFTLDNGSWPTQIMKYDTDGATSLSTVKNTWDLSVACTLNICAGRGHQDVRKITTSTTLPIPGSSITKQTTYAYDTPQTGNVTAIKEWKYQNGSAPTFPSVPDRATYTTYAMIGGNNIINRPHTLSVCNNTGTDSNCAGGGSRVAQTIITYDVYGRTNCRSVTGLVPVMGIAYHDDTNYPASYTTRGNATTIQRWVSGSTYLSTNLYYDITGQIVEADDPALNATCFNYADKFFNDNGSDPAQVFTPAVPTNAYLTNITDTVGAVSMGYYFGSGSVALSTDYNSLTTFAHYMDPFDRPTDTDYPVGWALNTYGVPAQGQAQNDSYSAVGDAAASASCVSCTHAQVLLDQLGEVLSGNLVNNPAGEVSVNNTYGVMNRILSSSHPHIGTTDPNNVSELLYYDGLGRTLGIQHPDNERARTAYGANVGALAGLTSQQSSAATYGYGFPVASLDEAGKPRQQWIDGFGHVIEVDEPSSNTSTFGTATITVSGSEGSSEKCNPYTCICHTVYDSGYLKVTVNGFAVSAFWGKGSTAASVAATLAGGLNSPESPVTAVVNGTVITMTAGGPGAYTISFQESFLYNDFTFSPTSGTLTGGAGGLISSPNITTYTYDVLGNLTGVTQGVQSRSYQYDGLSRPTQGTTPEAGTVKFSYVNSSNAVCSGKPANPCTKTDARNVVTTYSYDTANRLTGKTHVPTTTGSEGYQYGTSSTLYNIGRLLIMTDPSGSETYIYDKMGHVTQLAKTIGSTTYTTSYGYNAGGQLIQITYPSGRHVYNVYDNVGHLCLVSAVSSTTCSSTSPYLSIASANYDAASRPLSVTYGNGVIATASYFPQRSQLQSLSYAKGGTTLFGLNYYYQKDSTNCPSGSTIGNDSEIQCITDTVQSGRTVSYTYDPLSRLLTANTSGSTAYPAWGLSETYDRYGNRTAQSVTAGSGYASSLTISTANNQISNFTYDASGNVTAEPSPISATFNYDGEECVTSFTGNGNSATYTCDGNNSRAKKVVTGTNAVTTVYIRSGGEVIAEYDNAAAVTAPTREYIFGHHRLATVVGSANGAGGTITYEHRDHLSPRLFTDVNGNDVGESGHYPFGEPWYKNNSTSNWVFTTYERDQESGLDYALARLYYSNLGRFMSPDPLNGNISNPQSLNRYAYALNEPSNSTDPTGADSDGPDGDGDSDDPNYGTLNIDFNDLGSTFTGPIPNPDNSYDIGVYNGFMMYGGSSLSSADVIVSANFVFNPSAQLLTAATAQGTSSILSGVQFALNLVGAIPFPPTAIIANLANAGISTYRGNYGQAALYGGGALLSVVGLGATGSVLGEIGQAAEVAEEIEQGAQAGSELLLDTNVVIGEGKQFIAAGDNVVKASVTDVEIGNLVQQGRIGLPRAAGEIPTVPNSPNINLRVNVRGLLTPKVSGNFADGIIGATALERGATLVTHDAALGSAVSSLGGNIILLP